MEPSTRDDAGARREPVPAPRPAPPRLDELVAAHREIAHLQQALDTRIVIEQAKGYLAASADVSPAAAFSVLRTFSRDRNLKLRQVCSDLVAGTLASREDLLAAARDDQLSQARATAQSLVARSSELLVAARGHVEESFRLLGHAVPDIGELTASKGTTLCTLTLGNEVDLVPEMRWEHVANQQRCPRCVAAAATQCA